MWSRAADDDELQWTWMARERPGSRSYARTSIPARAMHRPPSLAPATATNTGALDALVKSVVKSP